MVLHEVKTAAKWETPEEQEVRSRMCFLIINYQGNQNTAILSQLSSFTTVSKLFKKWSSLCSIIFCQSLFWQNYLGVLTNNFTTLNCIVPVDMWFTTTFISPSSISYSSSSTSAFQNTRQETVWCWRQDAFSKLYSSNLWFSVPQLMFLFPSF